LIHEVADCEFVPGQDLLDVLASSREETLAGWLQRWRRVVARATSQTEPEGLVSIELGLHNFVVREDGELVLIDQEWWHREYKERQVIERSIFWLALFLAERCPPERWQVERVGDLALALGADVGLEPDGRWLSLAVAREAALQAEVHDSPPGSSSWGSAVEIYRNRLQNFLDRKLTDTALGMREHELRASLEAESDLALTEKEEQLREVRQQLETATSTVGFRLLERARRVINWSAPPGTRRRSVLSWFRRGLWVI
jgi:hypothetical protein